VSRALVLVNPAAGGGRAWGVWERLQRRLPPARSLPVQRPADRAATRLAVQQAVEGGYERLVVFGGDGTLHLVANALLEVGAGQRVTLGVVPAGTGSDLARSLRIPRRLRAALTLALEGEGVPVDAGRCLGERASFHFINETSAGVAGLVDESVNAMPRRGATAFLVATVRALRRFRAVPMRLEVDGECWYEGPTFLATVANGTSFGKGMHIAPQAQWDDGWFDVVVVGEVRGTELVRRLPQVYLGTHLQARPVRVRRAKVVHLEPLAPAPPFDVDGETYPCGPATFEILPAALRVVAGPR
jgi:diacylglycerol kinase (ATP)